MSHVSMEEPLWASTKIFTNVIISSDTSQYSDCYCTPTPYIHIYLHAWFVVNKIIIQDLCVKLCHTISHHPYSHHN